MLNKSEKINLSVKKHNLISRIIYIIKKRRDLFLSFHALKGWTTLLIFLCLKIHKYIFVDVDTLRDISDLARYGLPISREGLLRLINKLPTIFKIDEVYFIAQDLSYYSRGIRLAPEPETLKFIKKYFKENHGIFVDVGACVGGYAIRIAKYAKRVYAIEPEPKNFYFLKLNKEINKINNLIIINAAAYYTKTKIPLYVSNKHVLHSIVSKISKDTIIVDTTTLDEILSKEELIDIIKIDVEGAEHFVLEGAKEILKKTKYIIIEVSNSFKKIKNILENNNFKLMRYLDINANALFINKNFSV